MSAPADVSEADISPEIIEVKGRPYLRRDLWKPEELERMKYEGNPRLPSTTASVLAAQLRAHMRGRGGYYIEMEPDLELAKRILAGDAPREGTPSAPPRKAREVQGQDHRQHTASAMTYPSTALGFSEVGCTLAKVGNRTLYTAAHCLWNLTTNGWYCNDQSTAVNGTCATWPRYKFGVEDMSAFSGWTANACQHEYLSQAFTGLEETTDVSEQWLYARWDYAVIDLQECVTGNTGWLGTWISADATLTGLTFLWGYPARAVCPDDAKGQPGGRGTGGTIIGTDCPGTGTTWPGTTWRVSGSGTHGSRAPFTGAEIWGQNSSGGAEPGLQQSAHTISIHHDETPGMSGAPLYFKLTPDDRRVLGIVSYGGSDTNKGNRFTIETHNFFMSKTDWPDD